MTQKTLWGGRFTGEIDAVMEKFNQSLSFDQRLWQVDVQGSKAYANALHECNLITGTECELLLEGLTKVENEWAANNFKILQSDEDIHTANERRLNELIGPVSGKLHTGRSRNDQVATDMRLWLREEIKQVQQLLHKLIKGAVDRAQDEIQVLMPGFTHLQRAQPIRWSHWILSHTWQWKNDLDKLANVLQSTNQLPLGSGALAGNPFPNFNRKSLASMLDFPVIIQNSMLAVSDRDFIVDFLYWATLLMTHLSRWAEDLIIYSALEFGFVRLSDAYSTGSSLMPQKKNPDSLELIRGKSGRMTGLLMTLKGTPSTYNKDFQEDKEPLFDSVDQIKGCLSIACGVLSTLEVPFRETHHISGQAVKICEDRKIGLDQLKPSDFKALHPKFEDDVMELWDFERSVENRQATGGCSKNAVMDQITTLKSMLKE